MLQEPSALQTSVPQIFTEHPLGPVDVVASKPDVSLRSRLTVGDKTGLWMSRASPQEADGYTWRWRSQGEAQGVG